MKRKIVFLIVFAIGILLLTICTCSGADNVTPQETLMINEYIISEHGSLDVGILNIGYGNTDFTYIDDNGNQRNGYAASLHLWMSENSVDPQNTTAPVGEILFYGGYRIEVRDIWKCAGSAINPHYCIRLMIDEVGSP